MVGGAYHAFAVHDTGGCKAAKINSAWCSACSTQRGTKAPRKASGFLTLRILVRDEASLRKTLVFCSPPAGPVRVRDGQ